LSKDIDLLAVSSSDDVVGTFLLVSSDVIWVKGCLKRGDGLELILKLVEEGGLEDS